MQYCTRCGNLINEGEDFCSKCGQPVKREQTGTQEQRTPTAAAPSGGTGTAAIVLGILGIIVGFLLMPLVGIIMGLIAIVLGASASGQGDKNGTAGVVLGILALALSVLGGIIGFLIVMSLFM